MSMARGELLERKQAVPIRSRTKAALAAASLLMVAGCTAESTGGSGADASPSGPAATVKSATPSPKASSPAKTTETACLPGAGYEASKRFNNNEVQLSKLIGVQVRLGEHACHESLVIQLGGDDDTKPGVHAHYVNTPIKADPSNKNIEVDGKAFLEIDLGASMHDAAGQLIAFRTVGPSEGVINEVLRTSDYEGQSSLVIGLDRRLPFTLTEVSQTEGCPQLCEVINIRSQ